MVVRVKKISPTKKLLTIGGIPITGYGSGTYIELTFPNNLFNETDGADGEIALNEVANGMKANLTFQVLETADVNAALWTLMGSKILVPVLFKDLLGVTLWESSDCNFTKAPDLTEDKDGATNRAWQLTLPEVLGVVGGN